jgi:hypothetical protein
MSDDQSTPVPPGLTRLTVNLTPRAQSAMHAAARMLDQTNTDTVCIALMVYAQLVEMGEHEGVYRVTAPDVGGRPLYMRVSRTPFKARKWWLW